MANRIGTYRGVLVREKSIAVLPDLFRQQWLQIMENFWITNKSGHDSADGAYFFLNQILKGNVNLIFIRKTIR
jgi:hypothetical protein